MSRFKLGTVGSSPALDITGGHYHGFYTRESQTHSPINLTVLSSISIRGDTYYDSVYSIPIRTECVGEGRV